ncbi:hypothetical protein [Nocardia iowensis]|uniref:Uncharacterized protein n=1 Tax=Nocardia iowensis TaxID=204891 RepID=A0ABX8RWJ3_NOCIO|nr:hypothetical protein [Nocardia iowensis]QXN94023.1 hypothetical protein KV110_13740 [Nocardia iowensis]
MDNDPDQAQTFDLDKLAHLIAAALQQSRPPDRPESSTVDAENDLTLSIFSELQYALQSRNLSSTGPLTQRLPAQVNPYGELEFGKPLPGYAAKAVVVHRGSRPPEAHQVCGGTQPTLDLRHPGEVVAVQLQDSEHRLRLVTFVTHAPRDQRGYGPAAAAQADPAPAT